MVSIMRIMSVRGVPPLVYLLILSWNAELTQVKGSNDWSNFAELDRGNVIDSKVQVSTCCPQLDLNLPHQQDCRLLRNSGNKLSSSPKHFIFQSNLMAEDVPTRFQLKAVDLPCKLSSARVTYLHLETFENTQSVKLLRNGYLKVDEEYYPPGEYCINEKSYSSLEVVTCPQTCGRGGRPCIQKCCSFDKVYSFGIKREMGKGCFPPKGDYFRPNFYQDFSTKSDKDIPDPFFVENYPRNFKYLCPSNRTVVYMFPEAMAKLYENINVKLNHLIFRIREDGKIIFKPNYEDTQFGILDPAKDPFCIDGAVNYGGDNLTYVNSDKELVIFFCAGPFNLNKNAGSGMLHGSVMLASSAMFVLLKIGKLS